MADPSSRRKLAAILSADVVGYSRLMAANEAATVETLKSYRKIIARLVGRRGGRVVNAMGMASTSLRAWRPLPRAAVFASPPRSMMPSKASLPLGSIR